MASSSPASRVSARAGTAAKSMTGGPGQLGVPAGGGGAGAGLGRGAAQQPAEPLLGEDLPDPGAVQRGALGAQPGADLVRPTGPPRRSSTTRARARSLAGALFGPGLPGGANSSSRRPGSRAAGWPCWNGCSRTGLPASATVTPSVK